MSAGTAVSRYGRVPSRFSLEKVCSAARASHLTLPQTLLPFGRVECEKGAFLAAKKRSPNASCVSQDLVSHISKYVESARQTA